MNIKQKKNLENRKYVYKLLIELKQFKCVLILSNVPLCGYTGILLYLKTIESI